MTFSFSNLSLAGVKAATGSKVLDPGRYVCVTRDAKIEDTKAKDGKILKVRLVEENGAGSIIANLNLLNKSEEATRIGLEQLKGLLVAGGHPDPDNVGNHGVESINGLRVGVSVGSEMYQGERRSRVNSFLRPDDVAAKSGESSKTGPDSDIPF